MSICLVRYDLNSFDHSKLETKRQELVETPKNRAELISEYDLPTNSIIKLKTKGQLIPWSLLPQCSNVEIQVFRPHQHVKPKVSKYIPADDLFRETVRRLESRIGSLEEASDPAVIQFKVERDLEALTKQITFLNRLMTDVDSADWKQNPDTRVSSTTLHLKNEY